MTPVYGRTGWRGQGSIGIERRRLREGGRCPARWGIGCGRGGCAHGGRGWGPARARAGARTGPPLTGGAIDGAIGKCAPPQPERGTWGPATRTLHPRPFVYLCAHPHRCVCGSSGLGPGPERRGQGQALRSNMRKGGLVGWLGGSVAGLEASESPHLPPSPGMQQPLQPPQKECQPCCLSSPWSSGPDLVSRVSRNDPNTNAHVHPVPWSAHAARAFWVAKRVLFSHWDADPPPPYPSPPPRPSRCPSADIGVPTAAAIPWGDDG